MSLHVIVGAGPTGTATAALLLDAGHTVRVITRSGSGAEGTERVKADAGDAARLSELTDGAVAIYNCVNPPYHRWPTDWPPVAGALLQAAERSGAVLATINNVYGYGPVDGVMTEQTPLNATGTKARVRIAMTEDALAAHAAGRIRYTEVRGGDFVGPNAQSLLSFLVLPKLKAGKRALIPAALDEPHSWTAVADMARLLVTAAADERAWGRAWHAPTAPPATIRELVDLAADALGTTAKITSLPYAALWAAGLFDPMAKELRETSYQFRLPFVLDSSAAEQTFGLSPTPLRDSVRAQVEAA